jgi:hypothetical protein
MQLVKDYASIINPLIIAAVAAYLGAWLGRRNEHAKWLREQRLQVYSDWLGALWRGETLLENTYHVRSLVVRADTVRKGIATDSPTAVSKLAVVIEDLAKFDKMNEELYANAFKDRVLERSLYTRLEMLAGEKVREKAQKLNALPFLSGKLEETEQERLRIAWNGAVNEFLTEARKELGLK